MKKRISHITFKKVRAKMISITKRYWGTSLLALFFLAISYVFSNLDLAIVDDNEVLKWIKATQYEFLSDDSNSEVPDSILLINTSYSNMLVDIVDSYGRKTGDINITDRSKLLRFLNMLKRHNNYKYIMLDVNLTTQYQTEFDDSLFSTITTMRDIVVAKVDSMPVDKRIADKCYAPSYRTSILNSDCVKFPLFYKSEESFPYKAFTDLTGRSIKHFGPFYYEGWHLARRTIYPDYTLIVRSQFSNDITNLFDQEKYYNIGDRFFKKYDNEAAADFFRDRIVVIGDFAEFDMHMTYVGKISGPLINLNVLTSLYKNAHQIPYYLLLLLYIIFFIISDNLLHKKYDTSISLTEQQIKAHGKISKEIVPIALLSTYYTLLLIVLCALIYLLTGQAYDILFTGIVIGITHWIIKLIRRIKTKRDNRI